MRAIGKTKMKRSFLEGGVWCRVALAAVVTFTATIPGINHHWQMEIVKRAAQCGALTRIARLLAEWVPVILTAVKDLAQVDCSLRLAGGFFDRL